MCIAVTGLYHFDVCIGCFWVFVGCLIIPKCSRVTSEFKALQFVAAQLQIALWDVMLEHCCSFTTKLLFSHILKYL